MAYEGSVELISGITPKNGQNFPLVDAKDVRVDDSTRLDAALESNESELTALKDDLNNTGYKKVTFSSTGGQHSSLSDTCDIEIPQGETFYIIPESTSFFGAQYVGYYSDSTSGVLVSGTKPNALYQLVAEKTIIRIGVYIVGQSSAYEYSFTVIRDKSPFLSTYTEELNSKEFQLNANGFQSFHPYARFANGGLKTSGLFEYSQYYRVSCVDHIVLDSDTTISVAPGYRWGYIPFVDGEAKAWQGWFAKDQIIPAGTEFVMQISKSPSDDTSKSANISDYVSAIRFATNLKSVEKSLQIKDYVDMYSIVQGTIASNGVTDDTNPNRCRTFDLIPISKYNTVHILEPTTYKVGIHYYDASGNHLFATNWVPTEYVTISPPPEEYVDTSVLPLVTNAVYVKLVLAKKSDGNVSSTDLVKKYELECIQINDVLNELYSQYAIPAPRKYVGEEMPSAVHGYDIERLFTMSYSNQTSQDIDVLGDYLFVAFSGTEQIKVYSLSQHTLIATIDVETIHGSSIQFSGEYYDANDDFPLLYTGGWSTNLINVIRITKTSDTWSATVVRTLHIPETSGYYASPNVDANSNVLYTYAHLNNNVADTNHRIIASWNLNNLTQNNDDTYTPELLTQVKSPYIGTYQGHKYYGGNIYITTSNTTSPYNPKLFAIDCGTGAIKTAVDLSGTVTLETEGLCYQIEGNKINWFVSEYYKVFKLKFA